MVLVDSSVWIAHFREGNREFAELLRGGLVLMHPFVCGELACGNLGNRSAVLASLGALPLAYSVSEAEAMHLIESRGLWGKGLGWVDVNLLASAMVSKCRLWTLDKRLRVAAGELGAAY